LDQSQNASEEDLIDEKGIEESEIGSKAKKILGRLV
jgi:hypothetical protein